MSVSLPEAIFNLSGQVVKEVNFDPDLGIINLYCNRDKRYKVVDPECHKKATINRYIRRTVKDLPLLSYKCLIEIELAETRLPCGTRRIEQCDFVEKGFYYTHRFCKLISGLCRHMSIQSVAKHFSLRWETVKNMDKCYLQATLPALEPSKIVDLKYMGVDEVAKAKGHEYMTVVYDLGTGQLIWVHEGRTSDVFSLFLKGLSNTTKQGVLAVAMDMGLAYQKSIKEHLPTADIVFDRFHVMQNFSRAIDNQRRVEFRRASKSGKDLIKGSRFLLLKNAKKLDDKEQQKLDVLLSENKNINSIYILKEQLQAIWSCETYESMATAINNWCYMATETNLIYMKKFSKSLQRHKQGICNYAKYPLTTARVESGNVAIGMLRKRARGISDTNYFKLKIRQLGTLEDAPLFYNLNTRMTQ